jgi:ABC-type antimicrobial peptide transport system permease subunit
VLIIAVTFSMLLGLIGGAWPAFRACRMKPTEALRRV